MPDLNIIHQWFLRAEKCGFCPKGSKAVGHKQEYVFELSWLNLKNSCEFCVFPYFDVCVCLSIRMRNCFFLYNFFFYKIDNKRRWTLFIPQCHGLLGSPARSHVGSTPWSENCGEAVAPCAVELGQMISFWGTIHSLSLLEEIRSVVLGPGELANQPRLLLAR